MKKTQLITNFSIALAVAAVAAVAASIEIRLVSPF